MSCFMDRTKDQPERVGIPADVPGDVIISADTHRQNRVPPDHSRTKKWQVLDANWPPRVDLTQRRLQISGLVNRTVEFTWQEFLDLPRVFVFSDFHCVTRWSRLRNMREGVSTAELLARAGGLRTDAHYVLAHGYDRGFSTNLPLTDFLAKDELVAFHHDGEEISLDPGGPARLIVPRWHAWKSAKWLNELEFLPSERERYGW
jgi:DMSO/TMAO reductase YedYZ molybdopterin-dependent catalytic subunit